VDLSGTITPGGAAVVVTTTVPGQDARYTFSGSAGQQVSLLVTNVSNTATVNLLNPSGTQQAQVSIAPSGPDFMDTQVLSTTGTYTLWIQHAANNPAFGSETLQLYSVPSATEATAVIGGSNITLTTTVPGQIAAVLFSGNAGEAVSFHTVSSTMGTPTTISLILTNGTVLAAPWVLPVTGDYLITIHPWMVAGSMTLNLTSP